MAEGKGKLAEALAESIAEKLGNDGSWFDTRFDDILAAVRDIMWSDTMSLKRVYDSQELYNNNVLELVAAAAKVIDSKSDSTNKSNDSNKKNSANKSNDLTNEQGTETEQNTEEEFEENTSEESQTGNNKTSISKKINKLEHNQYRILGGIENIKKNNKNNVESVIKESEKRTHARTVKMERSIKRTIKSRMGKLWSMFKKTLIIGLLLFFAPVLKKAFGKLADLLSPVVDWFKINFPKLYNYIKDLSAYVGSLASDFKFLVDKIQAVLDWTEENSTLIKGIKGAIAGAGMGALLGTVVPGIGNVAGALLGGLIGFGVGAGSDKLKEVFGDPNPTNKAGKTATITELAEGYADEDLREGKITKAQYDNTVKEYKATFKKERKRKSKKERTATNMDNYEKQRKEANESSDYWLSLTPAERLQYMQRNSKPASTTTSASSTETAADEQESALNGKTTVEPNDNTGNNNIIYNVEQHSTTNNYIVTKEENLWNTD